MLSITLDPRILAPPLDTAPADAFREYVTSLLRWTRLAKEPSLSVTLSRHAASYLAEDHALPLAPQLQRVLASKGIVEYDLKTLKSFSENLLRLSPCFEESISIEEVLHENTAFKPGLQPCPHLPSSTAESERCLVILALLAHCQCSEAGSSGFALRRPFEGQEVFVTARVHDVQHSRHDLGHLSTLPVDISECVAVRVNVEHLLLHLNEAQLFMDANNDHALNFAINVAIYKSRAARNEDPDWLEIKKVKYRIGLKFRTQAQLVGRLKTALPGGILAASADAIEGLNKNQTHCLRTGSAGSDPQRTSGAFKAWRRDITSDQHLHYWIGPGGLVELGWVSHPHDDMHLPLPIET